MAYWLAWEEPRAVGDLVHVEKFFARNLGGLIHARTRVPGSRPLNRQQLISSALNLTFSERESEDGFSAGSIDVPQAWPTTDVLLGAFYWPGRDFSWSPGVTEDPGILSLLVKSAFGRSSGIARPSTI